MEYTHELKILPEHFKKVISGDKRFEIRNNDREFYVGDIVLLNEYDLDGYTGENYGVEITYITDFNQKAGFIVFSFKPLSTMDTE